MQFVTSGGRLNPPNTSTPGPINALMTQCWNSVPELRPNFSTIIERLGYALVDPVVLRTPLPTFTRAPSEDTTVMRPPADATDYLVPNHPCSNSASNYSVSTEKTELLSPDTCSTATEDCHLVELMDDYISGPSLPAKKTVSGGTWKETPFTEETPGPSTSSSSTLTSGIEMSRDVSSSKINNRANEVQLDPSKLVSPSSSGTSISVITSTPTANNSSSSTTFPKKYVNVWNFSYFVTASELFLSSPVFRFPSLIWKTNAEYIYSIHVKYCIPWSWLNNEIIWCSRNHIK